jgi:hypothetical protein
MAEKAKSNPLPPSNIACHVPEALEAGLQAARQEPDRPQVRALLAQADAALQKGPWSVAGKPKMPPTGTMHDYWSLSIYLWPNPDTEDGLPYLPRPEINPEALEMDKGRLSEMQRAVEFCALAWAVTRDERYAERAALFLRAWFLDPATRMHPNMVLAQWVPGRSGFRSPPQYPPRYVPGRGGREGAFVSFGGVIEGLGLPALLDAVGLLEDSDAWTEQDHRALQAWVRQFLQWLLTHRSGRDERSCPNNHGSWYVAQVMAYALFCGQTERARHWAMEHVPERIHIQVEQDGSMPHEIGRHAGLSYVTMTLQALVNAALLAERVGIDRWHYRTADGRSLRGAIDWALPYLAGRREWQWQQKRRWDAFRAVPVLCAAARRYGDARYAEALAGIPPDEGMPHLPLIYPAA